MFPFFDEEPVLRAAQSKKSRLFTQVLSGALTSSGDLLKRSSRVLAGAVALAGTLLHPVAKVLSGAVSLAGAWQPKRLNLRLISSAGVTGATGDSAIQCRLSNVTVGDLMVAFVTQMGSSHTFTATNGWTQIEQQNGAALFYKFTQANVSSFFETVCTSSDTTSADRTGVVSALYSGVQNRFSLDGWAYGLPDGSGTITTTTPDADPADGAIRLITIFASTHDTNTSRWSNWEVNGSTTGVTEHIDTRGTSSDNAMGFADKIELVTDPGSYVFSADHATTVPDGVIIAAIFVPYQSTDIAFQSLRGLVTQAGSLVRLVKTFLAGTVSSAGSLVKLIPRILSGAVSLGGSISKQIKKLFVAAVTSSGLITRLTERSVTGNVPGSGDSNKTTNRILLSDVLSSGSLDRVLSLLRSLTGAVSSSSDLNRFMHRLLGGSVDSSSTLSTTRVILRVLTGTVALGAGLLRRTSRSISAALQPDGSLIRLTKTAFTGSLTSSGTVARLFPKILSAAVSLNASLKATGQKVLTGQVAPVGTFLKKIFTTISAILGLSGSTTLGKQFVIDHTLSMAGSIQKNSFKLFTAIVTLTGSNLLVLSKFLSGTVDLISQRTRLIQKLLTGTLTLSGLLNKLRETNFVDGIRRILIRSDRAIEVPAEVPIVLPVEKAIEVIADPEIIVYERNCL